MTSPSPLFRMTTASMTCLGLLAFVMPKTPPFLAAFCCAFVTLVCARCLAAPGDTPQDKARSYFAL